MEIQFISGSKLSRPCRHMALLLLNIFRKNVQYQNHHLRSSLSAVFSRMCFNADWPNIPKVNILPHHPLHPSISSIHNFVYLYLGFDVCTTLYHSLSVDFWLFSPPHFQAQHVQNGTNNNVIWLTEGAGSQFRLKWDFSLSFLFVCSIFFGCAFVREWWPHLGRSTARAEPSWNSAIAALAPAVVLRSHRNWLLPFFFETI